MKAQHIRGLRVELPLEDAARLIVSVRTAELYAFVPEALGEEAVTAMHDMRIAAKRVRYLLEMVGFCFGEVGAEARDTARELQDVLGEIHDFDVLLERIEAMSASEPAGFAALAARFRAERAVQVARFHARWGEIERSRLRERLLAQAIPQPLDATVGA